MDFLIMISVRKFMVHVFWFDGVTLRYLTLAYPYHSNQSGLAYLWYLSRIPGNQWKSRVSIFKNTSKIMFQTWKRPTINHLSLSIICLAYLMGLFLCQTDDYPQNEVLDVIFRWKSDHFLCLSYSFKHITILEIISLYLMIQ